MCRSQCCSVFSRFTVIALLLSLSGFGSAATQGRVSSQQSSGSVRISAVIPPLFQVISSSQEANRFCAASKADHPVRVSGHYQNADGKIEEIDQQGQTDRLTNCNSQSAKALKLQTNTHNQGLLVLLFMAE